MASHVSYYSSHPVCVPLSALLLTLFPVGVSTYLQFHTYTCTDRHVDIEFTCVHVQVHM